MNALSLRTAVVVATLLIGIGVAAAQDYTAWSCRDLWVERNQIYKDAGYCFSTPRAIRTFGNANCVYDRQADVPMSNTQRRIIQALIRAERLNGCTD